MRSRRRDNFSVVRFFLKLIRQNTDEEKKKRTLEWLGEENKQKKARRRKCAWIIFQWISMSPTIHRYQTPQKSRCKHRCYRCQVPKFLQNLSRSFCPLDTKARASSARPTFASSLIDVFLLVFRFYVVHVYLQLTWIIGEMLGLTMLINWVASQFVVSV